jgi:hypothetical protein
MTAVIAEYAAQLQVSGFLRTPLIGKKQFDSTCPAFFDFTEKCVVLADSRHLSVDRAGFPMLTAQDSAP